MSQELPNLGRAGFTGVPPLMESDVLPDPAQARHVADAHLLPRHFYRLHIVRAQEVADDLGYPKFT